MMNTSPDHKIPLWQINSLLVAIWVLLNISINHTAPKSYAVFCISEFTGLSERNVFLAIGLLLLVFMPLSIKLIWNRFFTKLPNTSAIGYWHGFMCILILEIFNAYFTP